MPPSSMPSPARGWTVALGLFTQRRAALTQAEDQDAAMTGLTRSLSRRLLGLNFGRRGPSTRPAGDGLRRGTELPLDRKIA